MAVKTAKRKTKVKATKKKKGSNKRPTRKPVAISKKIATLKVFNPKTGEVFDEIEQTNIKDIKIIHQELVAGQVKWDALGLKNRQKAIRKVGAWLLANMEDVALAISRDNGKSTTEAIIAEIYPVIDLIKHFAKKSNDYLKDEKIPLGNPLLANKKSFLAYEGRGPILVISPWNYPFSIPMGEIIFALLAGNSVLLKASSETPLVGLKMLEVLRAAGIPDYAFQIATGPGRTLGEEILNFRWAHISFTGSVGIGKHVMKRAADFLTPIKMELGGKDPMIVCSDADLERAANAAIWGAFTNAGQTCASVERVYVMRDIADEFISLVTTKTNKLRNYIDDPEEYEIGPMTVSSQYEIVKKHIREAMSKARIVAGGLPEKRTAGWYIPATVIVDVDHSMKFMKEETFGPTLPIMKVDSIEQAIELANDSDFGLTASVFTSSNKRGKAIARKIKAGTVCINDCLYSHGLKETPWLGVKDSGFGVAHSKWGLEEMAQRKHINYDIMPTKRNLWWYPYNQDLHQAMKGAAAFSAKYSLLGLLKVLKIMKKLFTSF